MSDAPRKTAFHCPHCGFVQHEPAQLISTYCRSCGSYYKAVARASPSERAAKGKSGTLNSSKGTSVPARSIFCYQCGQTHEVSGHARNTICSGCNSSIELDDRVFSAHVSCPVDTRGRLIIESEGCLNTARAICGDAMISGKINGALHCEGTVYIASLGRLRCHITGRAMVIEKGAHVELLHPAKIFDLTVNGRAKGDFECGGRVLITKRGILEGRLVARSVVVEPGGSLLAESTIRSVKSGKGVPPKSSGPRQGAEALEAGVGLPAY